MNSDLWNRLDPGFLEPVWLLVGLLAIVTVLLLELGAQRRRQQAIRLFAASHLLQSLTGNISPVKRVLKRILLITAVGLLFTALARPHLFFQWREESRGGVDILLAIDCSKSMLTEDVKPNRLERAKLAVADFADHLTDNRLGLIAFAGDAFLQCPLTLDHDAFQASVRELDTDTIPRPGTDIATAIDQAVLALKSQPNNLKFLILITDGEDLEGRDIDAAKNAAQAGLKIYTVGVGTPAGGLIPQRDDTGAIAYLHDASGQIVQSKLDEITLHQIADLTGGAYVPLGQRGEGLEEIYNRYIATLPHQHLEERREKILFERFEWPLGAAILLLAWEFLVNERTTIPDTVPVGDFRPIKRRGKKTVATVPLLGSAALLLAALTGHARASDTATAERDYKAGQYEDALENYRKSIDSEPGRDDLQFNRGDAAYKAGEFSEAEEAFRKSLETPDLSLQEKAYYNLGNTQFKHGEGLQKDDSKKAIDLWQQALKSYESSMKLHDSADARHNYEVVKKKLEELKQQQQQQQQQDQNNPSKPKQDPSGKDSQNQEQNQDNKQQNPNNPQNNNPNASPPQQPGDKPQPQDQSQNNDQGKKDQSSQPLSAAGDPQKTQKQAHSQSRAEDQLDPGVKSRQEAEDLLDSLKEDERHVTARSLANLNNNEPPPPTPSGKDW